MDPEFRNLAAVDFRGRTLTGTVLAYGDVGIVELHGSVIRETFRPGAFTPIPDVPLVMQHDEAMPIAQPGEYELRDSDRALEIRATLPEKSAATHLVKTGALSGYSFKFWPVRERMEDGIRVIEKAKLGHIGLVSSGAYPGSVAEVRARGARGGRLFTARGRIPTGKRMACRCAPGKCREALFKRGSFDNVSDDEASEVLAISGDYSQAVASKKRGGIRFWNGADGSLEFAIDVPNTDRGKALMETMNTTNLIARPVIDKDLSDVAFDADGVLASYSFVKLKALLLGATDADEGWDPLKVGKDGEGPPAKPGPARRRAALWL